MYQQSNELYQTKQAIGTGIGGLNPCHTSEPTIRPSQVNEVMSNIHEEISRQKQLIENLFKKLNSVLRNEPKNEVAGKEPPMISYSAMLPQELNIEVLNKIKQHNLIIGELLNLIEL